MNELSEELAKEPCICGLFVEAPLKDVASYFRGQSVSIVQNSEGQRPQYEVTGAAAGIEQHFGPSTILCPTYSWIEEHFPLRGEQRISVVSSNTKFVLVESFCNVSWPYLAEDLHKWTGSNVFEFQSAIAPNPMLQNTPDVIAGGTVYPWSVFRAWQHGAERLVSVIKNQRVWRFRQQGEPVSLEDTQFYTKTKKADRLNRYILCKYMTKLGIDPHRTFIERDLLDPILFTSDHEGQSVEIYKDEYKRYIEYSKAEGLI